MRIFVLVCSAGRLDDEDGTTAMRMDWTGSAEEDGQQMNSMRDGNAGRQLGRRREELEANQMEINGKGQRARWKRYNAEE